MNDSIWNEIMRWILTSGTSIAIILILMLVFVVIAKTTVSRIRKLITQQIKNEERAKRIISAPSGYNMKGYSEENGYSKGDK